MGTEKCSLIDTPQVLICRPAIKLSLKKILGNSYSFYCTCKCCSHTRHFLKTRSSFLYTEPINLNAITVQVFRPPDHTGTWTSPFTHTTPPHCHCLSTYVYVSATSLSLSLSLSFITVISLNKNSRLIWVSVIYLSLIHI